LAAVRWPGRFEVVAGRPAVVIDGAHNPAGAAVLRATLDEVFPAGRWHSCSASSPTRISPALRRRWSARRRRGGVKPLSERAAEPAAVLAGVAAGRTAAAGAVAEAVDLARSMAGPDGVVCVAGSLYLVGPAREYVVL
jgi:dihydrofolate synthase/folylpolyglutamate synthase